VIDQLSPLRRQLPREIANDSSLLVNFKDLLSWADAIKPSRPLAFRLERITPVYNSRSMTEQIRKKLQEEIAALEHELVHELPKEIKKAAALGDLSENAEYHMAKQRQEFVKARVRQLGKRLADLSMVNMNNIPKDRVGLGSTVKVYDNTKEEEVEYNLVTSEESDVAAGKISTTSPIGRALLNKKIGDTAVVITPNGKRELEILKLTTIHDEAAAT
jgi:transcription elongation factor GreA